VTPYKALASLFFVPSRNTVKTRGCSRGTSQGVCTRGFHFIQSNPARSNRRIFRPAVSVWFAPTNPAKWYSTVQRGTAVVSVLCQCLPSFCLARFGWYLPWLALLCFALTLPSYLNCLLNSNPPVLSPSSNPTLTFLDRFRFRFNFLPPTFPIPWTWTCRQAAARRRRNHNSSKQSRRHRRHQLPPLQAPRHRLPLAE
jgi:hypothetical protein